MHALRRRAPPRPRRSVASRRCSHRAMRAARTSRSGRRRARCAAPAPHLRSRRSAPTAVRCRCSRRPPAVVARAAPRRRWCRRPSCPWSWGRARRRAGIRAAWRARNGPSATSVGVRGASRASAGGEVFPHPRRPRRPRRPRPQQTSQRYRRASNVIPNVIPTPTRRERDSDADTSRPKVNDSAAADAAGAVDSGDEAPPDGIKSLMSHYLGLGRMPSTGSPILVFHSIFFALAALLLAESHRAALGYCPLPPSPSVWSTNRLAWNSTPPHHRLALRPPRLVDREEVVVPVEHDRAPLGHGVVELHRHERRRPLAPPRPRKRHWRRQRAR